MWTAGARVTTDKATDKKPHGTLTSHLDRISIAALGRPEVAATPSQQSLDVIFVSRGLSSRGRRGARHVSASARGHFTVANPLRRLGTLSSLAGLSVVTTAVVLSNEQYKQKATDLWVPDSCQRRSRARGTPDTKSTM